MGEEAARAEDGQPNWGSCDRTGHVRDMAAGSKSRLGLPRGAEQRSVGRGSPNPTQPPVLRAAKLIQPASDGVRSLNSEKRERERERERGTDEVRAPAAPHQLPSSWAPVPSLEQRSGAATSSSSPTSSIAAGREPPRATLRGFVGGREGEREREREREREKVHSSSSACSAARKLAWLACLTHSSVPFSGGWSKACRGDLFLIMSSPNLDGRLLTDLFPIPGSFLPCLGTGNITPHSHVSTKGGSERASELVTGAHTHTHTQRASNRYRSEISQPRKWQRDSTLFGGRLASCSQMVERYERDHRPLGVYEFSPHHPDKFCFRRLAAIMRTLRMSECHRAITRSGLTC
ncbi:hypothetical protein Mp_1g23510 [Marchantia polymorpha subsp. ruderalis]|uniref:Uncharacterized protein n=2 Tax=Marchantia polymorpha TaxID=3197 RepID=A0AAF6ATH2_MARPO|nr:hypothetical protein MARPO_0065s0026 [Marchantia polymorpha]BBM99742.1 hypothetical protein Mp_1g23510 [Marchantia polymorpha subsp. ruderalis]|eukprot:PTQ36213.1 hypothetical protein MARPO_0065s0026 [Marchantia polymorpha]